MACAELACNIVEGAVIALVEPRLNGGMLKKREIHTVE